MSLPKSLVPTYEMVLPSSGKTIEYRPFLVKDEKVLLMAMEGNDVKEMVRALKQLIQTCSLTKLNVEELSLIDLEYFFIKIRSKSVDNISKLSYKCKNTVEDKECGNIVNVNINLDNIEVSKSEKFSDTVMLTKDVGLKLKIPNVKSLDHFTSSEASFDDQLKVIASSVECIFDKDNVYKDFTINEIVEYLGNLTQKQFSEIKVFFDNLPKIKHEIPFHCNKCGHKEILVLEGIQSFF